MPLLAALCALACVTGCTAQGGIGLAKVTFQRTTIPAASGDGGAPVADSGGTAFAAANLRTVDPCALLDADTLAPLGDPADPTPIGFGECDADMSDSGGNDLDVTITLGDELSSRGATTTVDGLPVSEEHDDSDCAERIITQQNPTLAVTVDVDYADHDACGAARKLIDPIVRRIRLDPPRLSPADAKLAAIDPCGTVDGPTVTAAIGADPDRSLEGLFKCDWDDNSLELSVAFTVDGDPAGDDSEGTPKPVSIDGIGAYQVASTDVFPSCAVRWKVAPAADDEFQQVDVEFDDIEDQHLDTCAKADAVAGVVAGKVPRPTA